MAGDRTIFDKPHHQSLELLAARALAAGDPATAFKLADRRCRISPIAEPHCYVLRAEASYRLGAKTAALADIAKALEIAPEDIAANLRMLAWADGPRQLQAALALIQQDQNFEAVRRAVEVLHRNGQRNLVSVKILPGAIEGWAVWERDTPLAISIADDARDMTRTFAPDAAHPLAAFGHAASFRVERPKSASAQQVLLASGGAVFHSARAARNGSAPQPRVPSPPPPNTGPAPVTVIVPVYGDYDATRACIESLRDELQASQHRAILVNDATPDAAIARHLAGLAAEASIEVIVNARNLGFIGSINRALAQIAAGDVVILNSDTVVPRGFIDRLAAAARSSPGIGTVTPLSNNGELTSFPIPYRFNPLPSRGEIDRIDAIAARANAGLVIDIPSGIGFCLYMTRACLDAVGPLSEDFDPGYLEDADFCLRAREQGFRNVCAASVYVGHAGSRSFGPEKRAIVVRNLAVLERRFPAHRMECATFMAADPLRRARDAIERSAAVAAGHPRLLVTGSGPIGATAHARARETGPALVLEAAKQDDGTFAKLINPAGGMPQSLAFDLASASERDALTDFLAGSAPPHIEFLDPANTPLELVDLLLRLKIPHDIFLADAGLLANVSRDRWQDIAAQARQILAPGPQAEAFATSTLPQPLIEKIRQTEQHSTPARRKQRQPTACHLGLVPVRSGPDEHRLMSELARTLNQIRPDITITVLGATIDDIGLMRGSNAFVTGAVDPDEFDELAATLGVGHLFVCTTQPLFAHPILSAVAVSSLPAARFDWLAGHDKPIEQDLAIDPRLSLDDIAEALSRWIPKAGHA